MLAKKMLDMADKYNEPCIPDRVLKEIEAKASKGGYSIIVKNLREPHIKGLKDEGFAVKQELSWYGKSSSENDTWEISWI